MMALISKFKIKSPYSINFCPFIKKINGEISIDFELCSIDFGNTTRRSLVENVPMLEKFTQKSLRMLSTNSHFLPSEKPAKKT